jgi:hypothetical protein
VRRLRRGGAPTLGHRWPLIPALSRLLAYLDEQVMPTYRPNTVVDRAEEGWRGSSSYLRVSLLLRSPRGRGPGGSPSAHECRSAETARGGHGRRRRLRLRRGSDGHKLNRRVRPFQGATCLVRERYRPGQASGGNRTPALRDHNLNCPRASFLLLELEGCSPAVSPNRQ